jgi:hypothetical protein
MDENIIISTKLKEHTLVCFSFYSSLVPHFPFAFKQLELVEVVEPLP